ncbi:class I SAM-dependent methyltransferase [Rhodospirillaceae bacterium KN72]|uniref:Class I SAM-dependent methyltransferase n=1 Tax=Pacificispira spongiicola TaxID=2729598 RepID=A0A7Y0E1W2_9PROT|nr:class I SAM-dependent methyltransferase [Pacificispira spongiicola]NMM45671.1 class I SAM-dependent methyltransferase [Pacificispira spongiicola]
MTDASPFYDTWHIDPAREASMGDAHAPMWRHFIDSIPERDFATRTVMDFGCNRGGFLHLLHALRPFRRGVGIDIATASIQVAEATKGTLPLTFAATTDLSPWANSIDIAFSYEVIYLLPDLSEHANALYNTLRDGGVYYAVTGCHTGSPLWSVWRTLLAETSNAPVQDRAPDDFAKAFLDAGFSVSAKRFGYAGFIPADNDRTYYPSLLDALDYPSDHKLLFRLEKRT